MEMKDIEGTAYTLIAYSKALRCKVRLVTVSYTHLFGYLCIDLTCHSIALHAIITMTEKTTTVDEFLYGVEAVNEVLWVLDGRNIAAHLAPACLLYTSDKERRVLFDKPLS